MGEGEAETVKQTASALKTESKDRCIVLVWMIKLRNGIDARLNKRLTGRVETVKTGRKLDNVKE